MQRVMRRLTDTRDKGATIVTFALFLMIMLGFVGVGIDGAAVYAKRQHVQTGADAAAFALAQEYALSGCVEDSALALTYAVPNVPNETATTAIDDVECGTNWVRVQASAEQPPFFLQAVGASSIRVPASATVEWGSPIEGTSVFPIAISYCSYFDAFGAANIGDTVNLNIPQPSDLTSGCSYSSDYPAGGFSWLDPTAGCSAFTSIGAWVGGDTGNNVPGACSAADFSSMIGKTLLLPVFDDARGTGANGEYHIAGYAAVLFKGFYFNTLSGSPKGGGASCSGLPTGPTMCMLLEFQGYATMDDDFVLGPITDPNNLVIQLKE